MVLHKSKKGLNTGNTLNFCNKFMLWSKYEKGFGTFRKSYDNCSVRQAQAIESKLGIADLLDTSDVSWNMLHSTKKKRGWELEDKLVGLIHQDSKDLCESDFRITVDSEEVRYAKYRGFSWGSYTAYHDSRAKLSSVYSRSKHSFRSDLRDIAEGRARASHEETRGENREKIPTVSYHFRKSWHICGIPGFMVNPYAQTRSRRERISRCTHNQRLTKKLKKEVKKLTGDVEGILAPEEDLWTRTIADTSEYSPVDCEDKIGIKCNSCIARSTMSVRLEDCIIPCVTKRKKGRKKKVRLCDWADVDEARFSELPSDNGKIMDDSARDYTGSIVHEDVENIENLDVISIPEVIKEDSSVCVRLLSTCLEPSELFEKFQERYIEGHTCPRCFCITLGRGNVVVFEQEEGKTSECGKLFYRVSVKSPRPEAAKCCVRRIRALEGNTTVTMEDITSCIEDHFDQMKIPCYEQTKTKRFQGSVTGKTVKGAVGSQLSGILGYCSQSYSMEEGEEVLLDHAVAQKSHYEPTLLSKQACKGDMCGICYCTSGPLSSTAHCGHNYCRECWQRYLISQLYAGRSRYTCPEYSCESPVLVPMVAAKLHGSYFQHFLKLKGEAFLNSTALLAWCPNSRCSALVSALDTPAEDLVRVSARAGLPLVCSSCSQTFCGRCRKSAHWPASCYHAERFRNLETSGGRTPSDAVLRVGVKTCIGCGEYISKDQGCQHMSCACGATWCWVCRKPWSAHDWEYCLQRGTSEQEVEVRSVFVVARYVGYHLAAGEAAAAVRRLTSLLRHHLAHTPAVPRKQHQGIPSDMTSVITLGLSLQTVAQHVAIVLSNVPTNRRARKLEYLYDRLNFTAHHVRETLSSGTSRKSLGRLKKVASLGSACLLEVAKESGRVSSWLHKLREKGVSETNLATFEIRYQ